MRSAQLFLALLLFAGCAAHERRAAATGRAAAGTIAVGQRWADAEGAATRAGYRLHDAAELAWNRPVEGFYVSLAGDRSLIALRDEAADAVRALMVVERASRPMSERATQSRQSFELPPAADGGG